MGDHVKENGENDLQDWKILMSRKYLSKKGGMNDP